MGHHLVGDLNPNGLSSFSPHLIHIQVFTVSHNWSHFRQPTVHTRHCGLPRASLVAAASCDQHMGFHRLSPSSREIVHLSWKNHWKTILELSQVSGYIEIQSGCQHPCPSSANHQSEVAAMVAANLDAVSAALESGDFFPMGETSGDDGPSIRISMLPWASCKGIAKQRTPGEAAVTLELSMGLAVSTLLKMTLYWWPSSQNGGEKKNIYIYIILYI